MRFYSLGHIFTFGDAVGQPLRDLHEPVRTLQFFVVRMWTVLKLHVVQFLQILDGQVMSQDGT